MNFYTYMTKLNRLQKENEKLRESCKILKREADFWKRDAKKLLERDTKYKAQLKLWKETGK